MEQLTTEPGVVERANALETSLSEANYAEYCRVRADKSTDQHGRYIWYFIKANFELNPKEEMLNLLGKIIFIFVDNKKNVQKFCFKAITRKTLMASSRNSSRKTKAIQNPMWIPSRPVYQR